MSIPYDRSVPVGSETPARILDAAVRCAGKMGVRRITMGDIAREAGLARVTLYSHFSTKDEILRTALLRDLTAFLTELENEEARHDDPEAKVVETAVVAVRTLRSHEVVQHLLRTEPEILLPFLVGDSPVMELARQWAAEQLLNTTDIDFAIDAEHGGELVMRLIHSLVLSPSSSYDLDDDDDLRRLLAAWLVPALLGGTSKAKAADGSPKGSARKG